MLDRPRAVLGVVDADGGEALVHGPLQAVGRVLHLRLDEVEQRRQVEAVGRLRDPVARQRPPALATTGSGSANQAARSSSTCGFFLTT